ncbi:MAG: bifunctional phosphoribosylaminoimidazolecarboxamide formyltransferase/IMP cyclohydrolase [Acidobacteriota bacterium]
MIHIRKALISVSDKTGIVDFARELQHLGVEIISTGGTHALLQANNIPAKQISELTGFPEILDGRVKTLHPVVHAGLLAMLDNPEHRAQLDEHGIESIDLVVVNLYPFESTIARAGVTLEEAIENIDIGGPTMLRSAAKNYRFTAAIIDPSRYEPVLEELRANECRLSEETSFSLARDVFRRTAQYDAAISSWLDNRSTGAGTLPGTFSLALPKAMDLRYGENPHQQAALYGGFLNSFRKLHGKELSFNNIIDANAAANLLSEFDEPACVIVKHTNPCGAACAGTLLDAYRLAFATDTKAPFGGIIAVNRELDLEAAAAMNAVFTEIIIAPSFAPGVLDFLMKKKDRRLIEFSTKETSGTALDIRSVADGLLVQTQDVKKTTAADLKVVTKRAPSDEELNALLFGWKVVKHVKSNAIVYAGPGRTLGIGAGQMSRVESSKIAVQKAAEEQLSLKGSIIASDAYFPFADGLLEAVQAGATAVIQPGGSVRDAEVIAAADEHGIAMVFTGVRHFRH